MSFERKRGLENGYTVYPLHPPIASVSASTCNLGAPLPLPLPLPLPRPRPLVEPGPCLLPFGPLADTSSAGNSFTTAPFSHRTPRPAVRSTTTSKKSILKTLDFSFAPSPLSADSNPSLRMTPFSLLQNGHPASIARRTLMYIRICASPLIPDITVLSLPTAGAAGSPAVPPGSTEARDGPVAKWIWFLPMDFRPPLARIFGQTAWNVPWTTVSGSDGGELVSERESCWRREDASTVLMLWPWVARIR